MDGTTQLGAVTCGCCGRPWAAHLFELLPFVGVQAVPAGSDGPAEQLELRNCACRSTVARQVTEERAAWLMWKQAAGKLTEALRTHHEIPAAAEAERRAWGAWRRAAA